MTRCVYPSKMLLDVLKNNYFTKYQYDIDVVYILQKCYLTY